MNRSVPISKNNFIVLSDRVLLGGMALGTLLMLQPVWAGGLKCGFFVTLVATVLEIVTGHMLPDRPGA